MHPATQFTIWILNCAIGVATCDGKAVKNSRFIGSTAGYNVVAIFFVIREILPIVAVEVAAQNGHMLIWTALINLSLTTYKTPI